MAPLRRVVLRVDSLVFLIYIWRKYDMSLLELYRGRPEVPRTRPSVA